MMANKCWLNGERDCTDLCVAYVKEGKTECRILNTVEKLVPAPSRPMAPPPPKVTK